MYGVIKKFYDVKHSVADSTRTALSGEDVNRRQALEALIGTGAGIMSLLYSRTAEAADWGIGVHVIKKVIPAGDYEVRLWDPKTKTEEPFLYIVNKPGQTKIPFGNQPKKTITDLEGTMTPEGIEKHVLGNYSSVNSDKYSIEVQKEKLKNGEVVYIVRKRVVIPKISWGKLYLEGPGTMQVGGGGGTGSGGTGSGGAGAGGD